MKKKIIIFIVAFISISSPVYANVAKISLNDAIELALKNNLTLQAKRKDLEIAKQEVKIANSLKNPQFQSNFLMGKVTRGNSSQFGLMVPFEIAKRGVRKKAALANLKAIENSIKESEHNLKIDVMRAYFQVIYLKSVLIIMKDREELFEDMKFAANAKPASSPNYQIEVLQSDIKYKKQLIELNKSKAHLLAAQFYFNKVLNLENSQIMYDTEEDSLFDDITILEFPIPTYDQIEKIAMVCSYSLRISDNYIEKSEYDVKVAEHKRIPDLTVGGGFAYQTARQTGGEALPGAFVAGSFDVPILYSYRPEINKAKLTLEKTKMDKTAFENKLKITLKVNYNDLKYAKENMQYYKQILKESDTILQMASKRYKNGETNLMALMLNENSHQQILSEYIESISVYYDAYLDLMYNMGHDLMLNEEIFL